ncbi:MAG: alpha/beta hydrolase [Candidatus Sericytochromatia bacterium]|nr:alpha/beta hydrolase [Candidatus Sericytochromatia bacterium]
MKYGWIQHTPEFWHDEFGSDYRLAIYTPPGYGESDKAYPVAYIFDAQSLYGDEGNHTGGWHLHEELDRRANNGQTVPIVVGIHNANMSRMEDLSPDWFQGKKGRGDAFLKWMIGPLADQINQQYRILPGRENTMIGGASLGGLMAVYAFFRHPDVFSKVLAMSPSLLSNPTDITNLAKFSDLPWPRKLYLEAGAHEPELRYGVETFVRHMLWQGFKLGDDVMWHMDPNGVHRESSWRQHLPFALSYLYD